MLTKNVIFAVLLIILLVSAPSPISYITWTAAVGLVWAAYILYD